MSVVESSGGPAQTSSGRFGSALSVIALVAGGLILALVAVDVPLARLAHQSLNANGGSSPVWFSAALGVVGFVVASRKPRNPLGWIMLASAAVSSLSQDASFYMVADYRLRHGGLPLGWVAVLAQPGWAVSIVLSGLLVLLFPDGRPPSPRWRWVLWLYLAAATLYLVGVLIASVGAIAGHDIRVDTSGNLMVLSHPTGSSMWWGVVEGVFLPVVAVCWLGSVVAQVASYRRSSGIRRQQLKWLLAGSAAALIGVLLTLFLSGMRGLPGLAGGIAGAVALLAIPACMGVAIMRYRLFDIDRIVSRTLAYAIVTGLLVGVYAGIVLLATRVVSIDEPVAVAGSTLAVAALFNPLRRRVQRAVDRRFNRARYDADRIVAAFAARLRDPASPDSVQDELASTVQNALEPTFLSVWLRLEQEGTR
jgi:MFS family permease